MNCVRVRLCAAGKMRFGLPAILEVFPMDVEQTMEFILQQQAKAVGQMAAIRKLIRTGMQMIVKNEEHLKELSTAQTATETKLQGLIDALRRAGNGRRSKN